MDIEIRNMVEYSLRLKYGGNINFGRNPSVPEIPERVAVGRMAYG